MSIVDKFIKFSISNLNHLYYSRIKDGTVSIENKNQYEVLIPTTTSDEEGHYSEALKVALHTPNTNNIAITGTYGSGKSSFIEKFKLHNAEWEYLPISLATFKNQKDDIDKPEIDETYIPKKETNTTNTSEKEEVKKTKYELHQDVERSILQQFFYREKDTKVPFSRFKRIKNIKKKVVLLHSFCIGIIFLYGFLSFYPNEFKKIFLFNPLELVNIEYYKFISIILFALVFYYFYRLFKYLWNIQVSKFNFKKGEITLAKQDKASILNEHLDEILYFFETTDYDIVIFEDLDRFGDTEIFIKLRELNNLINNSKQIGKRVIFIYAIKDDMFEDKDRTKFFDFILPIIPYINPSNSDIKLRNKFKNEIDKSLISEDFLGKISLYIDDMRLLLNIYNEYTLYKNNLNSDKLNHNKLLALIVCKNFYPLEFSKLHYRDGLIYNLFFNKPSYIQNQTDKYNTSILNIKKEIEIIEDENLESIEELKLLYVGKFINEIEGTYFKFNNQGQEYTISLITIENIFDNWVDGTRLYVYEKNQYQSPISQKWVKFEDFDKLSFTESLYLNRKKIIEDKLNNKLDTLKQELESLSTNINKLQLSTLQELYKIASTEIITDDYEDKELLIFLTRHGYIDEKYEQYISYFHKGGITLEDREFLLSIQNFKPLEHSFKLGNISELIKKLDDREFKQKEILNFDLLTYLLDNQPTYNNKLQMIFQQLENEDKLSIDFIFKYLEIANDEHKIKFLQQLQWNGLWLYIRDTFSQELQDNYFESLFKSLKVDRLIKLNIDDKLQSYLAIKTKLPILEDTLNKKYQELITKLSIKYTSIENPSENSKLFDFIYENSHYLLNEDMIELIIKIKTDIGIDTLKKEHYTSILNSDCTALIEYIKDNIDEYIREIFLKIDSNILESELTIMKLLNNKSITHQHKIAIIEKEEEKTSDIREILTEDDMWNELVKANKLKATWDNLLTIYIEEERLSDTVIEFINIEENHVILSESKINNKEDFEQGTLQAFNREIILCNDILDEAYKYIIKSVWYVEYKDLNIENLTTIKIDCLLERSKLDLVQHNIDSLKINFSPKHIVLIENFKEKFLEDFSTFAIDEEDVVKILNSSTFTKEDKFKIIEELDNSILDDVNLKEKTSKLYIDEQKEIEDISLFEKLFYGENQYDLELLILQIPYIDECSNIQTYLSEFSSPICDLLEHSGKSLYLYNTQLHQKLVTLLKAKDCISSFKDEDTILHSNKIKVNRKRG